MLVVPGPSFVRRRRAEEQAQLPAAPLRREASRESWPCAVTADPQVVWSVVLGTGCSQLHPDSLREVCGDDTV